MIELPKRSVTRFFIPLIDVLTLLFCIFLLMPLVRAPADEAVESTPENERRPGVEATPEDAAELGRLREEVETLRRVVSVPVSERLATRVLEIDAGNGVLIYHDPQPMRLLEEADAHALIEQDRRALAGGRQLFYLILYPRQATSVYPLRAQRERYERWFRDVAHHWDVPGLRPGRENKP